jgi:hypothetical protein
VQSCLRRQVEKEAWENLLQLTSQVTRIATTEGDSL